MAGPISLPEMSAHGRKRASTADDGLRQIKRQRPCLHRLRHLQPLPHALPDQDDSLFQMQLLRSISIALAAAGFDGTEPLALESFRAATEEFMLRIMAHVRQHMQACRRIQPLPQDFMHALAAENLTPSSLLPHLEQPIPPRITQPALSRLPSEEFTPPSLENILGPELIDVEERTRKPWILPHLPNYPSKHTWQSTPVYTTRAEDPLKIRERATQEGALAEQALRKLMTANTGGMRAVAGSLGRDRSVAERQRGDQVWEETMASLLQEEERSRARSLELEMDLGEDSGVPPGSKNPPAVRSDNRLMANYETRYWRKGPTAAAV